MQDCAHCRRPNSPMNGTCKKDIVFNNRGFVILVDKQSLLVADNAVADIAQWHGIACV